MPNLWTQLFIRGDKLWSQIETWKVLQNNFVYGSNIDQCLEEMTILIVTQCIENSKGEISLCRSLTERECQYVQIQREI